MIGAALSFLAGLLLVQQFPVLPEKKWLITIILMAGIMAWMRYWRSLFIVIGLLWGVLFATTRLADRLPDSLEGIDIPVHGVVSDLPEQDERRSRFDLIVTGSAHKLPAKLRLSWYDADQLIKAGQHWSFTVRLKRPHGSFNPGGFDYERWLFTEGVGATGYVRPTPKPVLLGRTSPWTDISVWRQTISERLSQMLSERASIALIKALTIGDSNEITQHQWDVFRKTGTTHLVVISGSHVGLVAGLVYFLVLKLWARVGFLAWSPQKAAAVAAMAVALFYAALAGFSVPTQRSVIMLSVVMLAIILQRHTRPFNVLAIALFAVLAFDPLAVLSAGFWLSFIAVCLIVYVVSGRLGKAGYFLEALKINWATSLGLAPLLLLFFQEVSLISPLANFIAVPIISLCVVPLSLVAMLVMFISPLLASKLFVLADISLQGLWRLLERLAELPMASITHAVPSVWAFVFLIPGILLLLAPLGLPGRWMSLVMFLPLIFSQSQKPETGNIKMTLLDVGQGLSAIVQTANHWLIFDTGAKFSADSDMGQNVVLPFLRQQGADRIDKLIISHGDNDHIGGAASVLRGIPTEQVLTSVSQQLKEYSPVPCAAGQSWTWDKVRFTVLSPEHPFVSENDNSCVLKIQSEKGSMLLTGDIEAQAESWLIMTYGINLKADVLIAPHHGSNTSSTTGFLQAVKPEYVLIPAGYRNQFDHPHPDVLQRYQRLKTKWLTSANSGAITINVREGSWEVTSMRDTEGKYWNIK